MWIGQGVGGEDVSIGQRQGAKYFHVPEMAGVDGDGGFPVCAAVGEEDRCGSVVGIVGGGGVDDPDDAVRGRVVFFACESGVQGNPVCVVGGQCEGEKCGLSPGRSAGFGHDGGDDVDQLGKGSGRAPVCLV